MRQVTLITGRAIPMDRSNVDTDQIIPAKHLKRIERTGYGPFAFEAWREDPDFVLNDPSFKGATIMLTRENFGSGSSREHAVWALDGLGIEALIGVSFADIFQNNCLQSAIVTVELPEADIDYLMDLVTTGPATVLSLDLASQMISVEGQEWTRRFEIDPHRKHRLAQGLDDIGMTLERDEDIADYEASRNAVVSTTQ